jgi:GNAT superfamily N-acetyltransferase
MVREAQLAEVYLVARFMKQFETCTQFVKVDVEYTTRVYRNFIKLGTGAVFILTDDSNNMIGGLGCIKGPDLHFPRTLAIETFWYVEPGSRGQGLRLVKAFEAWAHEHGCDGCAIVHLADSLENRLPKLYKKLGYKLVEQHFLKEL